MTYLREPDLRTMRIRSAFGACWTCGQAGHGCPCRHCHKCSRFWSAGSDMPRSEIPTRVYGIVTEDCEDCRKLWGTR